MAMEAQGHGIAYLLYKSSMCSGYGDMLWCEASTEVVVVVVVSVLVVGNIVSILTIFCQTVSNGDQSIYFTVRTSDSPTEITRPDGIAEFQPLSKSSVRFRLASFWNDD